MKLNMPAVKIIQGKVLFSVFLRVTEIIQKVARLLQIGKKKILLIISFNFSSQKPSDVDRPSVHKRQFWLILNNLLEERIKSL